MMPDDTEAIFAHFRRAAEHLRDGRIAEAEQEYPADRIHLVKGMVEDTIPVNAPQEIAIPRLDTDFYASTRHELAHLYPRLSVGGGLVIDDYGYLPGARAATDGYFLSEDRPMLLNRVNFTVRTGIKR